MCYKYEFTPVVGTNKQTNKHRQVTNKETDKL